MASRVDRQIQQLEQLVEKALESLPSNMGPEPLHLSAQNGQKEPLRFPFELSADADGDGSSNTFAGLERRDFAEADAGQK